jgi:hypothetical protein
MSSDFEELLRIFNGNEVRYLIVGGYAVILYTEPRYTKDLDVWVLANHENAARVWRALIEFGAPLVGLCPDDFAHEGFLYQIGQPPVRVDMLCRLTVSSSRKPGLSVDNRISAHSQLGSSAGRTF